MAAREWAAASARGLARRLRRQREALDSHVGDLVTRAGDLRVALRGHQRLDDANGMHHHNMGVALRAAVGRLPEQELRDIAVDKRLGDRARHAPFVATRDAVDDLPLVDPWERLLRAADAAVAAGVPLPPVPTVAPRRTTGETHCVADGGGRRSMRAEAPAFQPIGVWQPLCPVVPSTDLDTSASELARSALKIPCGPISVVVPTAFAFVEMPLTRYVVVEAQRSLDPVGTVDERLAPPVAVDAQVQTVCAVHGHDDPAETVATGGSGALVGTDAGGVFDGEGKLKVWTESCTTQACEACAASRIAHWWRGIAWPFGATMLKEVRNLHALRSSVAQTSGVPLDPADVVADYLEAHESSFVDDSMVGTALARAWRLVARLN